MNEETKEETNMAKTKMTKPQWENLMLLAEGLSGQNAPACAALKRRYLVTGDWAAGYTVSERGLWIVAEQKRRDRRAAITNNRWTGY
mgnify:CR=1 FL=1